LHGITRRRARYVGNTYGGTYTASGQNLPLSVPGFTVLDAVLH
jgi:hypothetical protein